MIGLLAVHGDTMNHHYLDETAQSVALHELGARALGEAEALS